MSWILQCLLCITLAAPIVHSISELAYYPIPIEKRTRNQQPVENYQPRMNERSIALTSETQKVQKERKRAGLWPDSGLRSENGSYKIMNSQLRYPTITNRRGVSEEKSESVVTFPGQTSAQKFVPRIPKECETLGICETVHNYPQELVDRIIAKLGDRLSNLQMDELDEPEIAQRFGTAVELPLCDSVEKIIQPQAAKGNDNNWYIILNNKNKPLQGYRVEFCRSNGTECNNANFYSRGGYSYRCKQKYVQRTMIAVDVKREMDVTLPFRVPSCCSCMAYHENDRK